MIRATTDRGVRGNSGLPESALIVVGTEHRLADDESLEAMVEAVDCMTTMRPRPNT